MQDAVKRVNEVTKIKERRFIKTLVFISAINPV